MAFQRMCVIVAAAVGLVACGSQTEIQLQPGLSPDEPTAPVDGAPGSESASRGGDHSGDYGENRDKSRGEGGRRPDAAPAPGRKPSQPAARKTILLCEQHGPGQLGLLAANATERDIPANIRLTDLDVETIDFNAQTIGNVRSPLALGVNAKGELEVALVARRRAEDSRSPAVPKVYLARIDIPYRAGRVTELATPPRASRAAEGMAARAGLSLRQHGVSADGKLVIVPEPRGYAIRRVSDGRTLATIEAKPETHFDPMIVPLGGAASGAGGVLTLLEFDPDEARFKVRAFRTAPAARDALSVQAVPVPPAAAGASQLGAVAWKGGSLAWLEAQVDPRGAVAAGARLVVWDPKGRSPAVAHAIDGAVPGSLLHGRPALVNEAGVSRAVVAVETYDHSPAGAKSIRQAELLFLGLSGKSAKSVAKAAYPAETIKRMREGTPGLGATALVGDAEGREVFVTLPGRWGVQTHRLVGGRLEPLTLFTCENPSLTRAVR